MADATEGRKPVHVAGVGAPNSFRAERPSCPMRWARFVDQPNDLEA